MKYELNYSQGKNFNIKDRIKLDFKKSEKKKKNQKRQILLSVRKRNDNPEDIMTVSLYTPRNIVSTTDRIAGGKKQLNLQLMGMSINSS